MQKLLLLNIHYALIERHAGGSVSAYRRVGVSAFGEVRLLSGTAIMTRRSRRS